MTGLNGFGECNHCAGMSMQYECSNCHRRMTYVQGYVEPAWADRPTITGSHYWLLRTPMTIPVMIFISTYPQDNPHVYFVGSGNFERLHGIVGRFLHIDHPKMPWEISEVSI